MKIKGIDKFQEKVSILSGKKIFLLPLYVIFYSFTLYLDFNKILFTI